MKAIVFLLFTLLVGAYTQTCTHTNTLSGSILPLETDAIHVQSLHPYYDNFNVKWDTSFSGNVEITMEICSNSDDEFNSFTYSLTNDNGVYLSLQKSNGSAPGGNDTNPDPTSSTPGSSSTTGVQASTNAGSSVSPSILLAALAACLLLPNKRISIVILALAAVFMLASPSAIAAPASSSTQITITIAVPPTFNTFCVANQCFNRTSYGSVTKYVSLFGKRFSGMGGMDLKCNESISIALDAGWTFSNDSREALMAIYMYGFSWNTWLIVTNNGLAYEAASNGVTAGYSAFYTVPDAFGPGQLGYRAQMCDSKLLITQDFPVPEPDHDIVAPPRISNFITFNGYDYGVADNVAYSASVATCPSLVGVYIDSNSAWQVAPNDDASSIAVSASTTTFGTQCLNVADGTAITSLGTACDNTFGFIPVSYNGGIVYFTPNCSRVLLRRASTLPNTFATQIPITNSFTTGLGVAGTYAMLSNINRQDSQAASCQTNFMSVPPGWRLTTSAELESFVLNNPWRYQTVFCFATAGFSYDYKNATCTTVVTKTVDSTPFYYPTSCAQILLIQSTA